MQSLLFTEKVPNFDLENSNNSLVFGIDEAGRGPLSGPVVAAAVCFLNQNISYLSDIKDSKKLSPKKREEVYKKIVTEQNIISSYAVIDVDVIDDINIFNATKLAMQTALNSAEREANTVLVDGNHKMINHTNVIPVVKGDDKSYSIAAASIIAKTVRDKIMEDIGLDFPEYNWQKNAGYGTKAHRDAIAKHGITKHHRKSFKLIA